MEKLQPKVIKVNKVKPYSFGEEYDSRMILDHTVTGRDGVIQMNHGTVKAGCKLGGGVHEADEIYYILSGRGKCKLNNDVVECLPDTVIFIPAGTFHALDNTESQEDLKILTFWKDYKDNDAYITRLKKWGVAYKEIDE